MLTNEMKNRVLEKLKIVDPSKVIIFGSHAYGKPDVNSDIDLLVVTSDEFMPKSFSDKMAVYLRVAEALTDIEKDVPIDLIVHTKAMHAKFITMDGMFARKIISQGDILYEKPH
jgi:predicted nucleotidyltransferase